MIVGFHQLPLSWMLGVILLIGVVIAWLLIGIVRFAIPRAGFWIEDPLPIRDSLINACGGLFALMVAFSAAGIWNDAVSARSAVQREADALENALVLAKSLPEEPQAAITRDLRAYARDVVAIDWPAMAQGIDQDDAVFTISEQHVLSAIDLMSREHARLATAATYVPLLNQLLEVRHARLARESASNAGITGVQWVAMWLIAAATLLVIVICNSHAFLMQIVAAHIYVVVASAAFFVILAHDRPFVGQVSIQPVAMRTLIGR